MSESEMLMVQKLRKAKIVNVNRVRLVFRGFERNICLREHITEKRPQKADPFDMHMQGGA